MTALLILVSMFTGLFLTNTAQAWSNDWYFIVTAYYSPLPNQSKYIMWSYEAEVRMNGQGYRWAGWKKVFSGMLAAPWIYGFWTKIYLEGLWVGEVADRGGAIVKAWERNFKHDRIDLWVGHWEEWLQRAMYWGKRTIKWSVVRSNTPANINVYKLAAPKWTTAYLPTNKKYKTKNTQYPFFNYWIGTKSKKESVKVLQEFLKKIDLYSWEITWVYNKQLMNSIYNYQKSNNIVSSWSDINAGYWSSRTRELVWKEYTAWKFTNKQSNIVVKQWKIAEKKIVLAASQKKEIAKKQEQSNELVDIFNKKISSEKGVKRLQRILKKLWFYNWEISGQYSHVRRSVLDFQLKNNVIAHKASIWAWNYGPSTRKTLDEAYKQYWINKQKEKDTTKAEKNNISTSNTQNQGKETIKLSPEKIAIAKQTVKNLGNIKPWNVSHEVRALQKILKTLWFFDHKDTAIYGPKTQAAITKYQLDRKVITDKSVYWAWLLGPKTKAQLIKDISEL